jgi:hypothetical protein
MTGNSILLITLGATVILGKEKIKLERLSASIADIYLFNELNLLNLDQGFIEYSKIIRALYKISPNVFANLYNYDMAEIKKRKKLISAQFADENEQANFLAYKESILNAIESAADYIKDYANL